MSIILMDISLILEILKSAKNDDNNINNNNLLPFNDHSDNQNKEHTVGEITVPESKELSNATEKC